ncbi:MAG: hypothetical protein HY231_05825 [Acidobacteria bacterium]|nr:hypothetical protein [Acidobacteriota bacterium]
MKKVVTGILMVASLLVFGCKIGKPAYDDIKVDKKTTGDNRESGGAATPNDGQGQTPSEDPIAKAERDAGIANPQSPAGAPEAQKPIHMPAFLDTVKGGIKDLPPFPHSAVANAQYGPVNGLDSAMYIYQTNKPPDQVAAYFEKSVKSNGWEIAANIKDPDSYEMTLIKGKRDQALIRIKKDTQTQLTSILLSRTQAPEGQSLITEPTKAVEKKK